MDNSKVDERFQSVFHDKRFQSIRQKQRKIKIDRRFHSMFTDDNFKVSVTLVGTSLKCFIIFKVYNEGISYKVVYPTGRKYATITVERY